MGGTRLSERDKEIGERKKGVEERWRRESFGSTIGFSVMVDSLKYREREKKFFLERVNFLSFFREETVEIGIIVVERIFFGKCIIYIRGLKFRLRGPICFL